MIWRISVRELKLIVDLLRDILLQIWLEFDVTGIKFLSVDPEKVASINMALAPSQQEYKCNEPFVFSFYLQSLFKILRGANKNEVAVFTCFRENKNEMVVRITGNDNQCFLIHRIQEPKPDYMPIPVPAVNTYTIEMDGDAFYTVVRDLSAVGKLLEVSANSEKQIIFGTRDALGTTAEYVLQDRLAKSEFSAQSYIIKYIEKFTKPGLTDKILIRFEEGGPIRFVWSMDYGYLALNVAPLPGKSTP
jgi:DNA polymerase III sliding clamp (beta) subunit (PCNA family)